MMFYMKVIITLIAIFTLICLIRAVTLFTKEKKLIQKRSELWLNMDKMRLDNELKEAKTSIFHYRIVATMSLLLIALIFAGHGMDEMMMLVIILSIVVLPKGMYQL